MNVKQTTKYIEKNRFCSFNTDLLDLIYTVKTLQCYFTFDYSTNTRILLDLPENIKHCLFNLCLCSIIFIYVCNFYFSMLIYSPTKLPQSLIYFFSK